MLAIFLNDDEQNINICDENLRLLNLFRSERCKSDRSRQELFNECLVEKCFFDTPDNDSSIVCKKVVRLLDRSS